MVFERYERKKGRLSAKIFYVFLAVGISAAGFGIWRGMGNEKIKSDVTSENAETYSIYSRERRTTAENEEANAEVTGIQDDRAVRESTEVTETRDDERLPYTGNFGLPMGSDIIKDYSAGELVKNETTGEWRTHDGIDFGGSKGNSVKSIQDGTVTAVYTDVLFGKVVEIDHGNGIVARYCGLESESTPVKGNKVKKYEEIGKLGTVPIETAADPHLHFEIRVNGKLSDPLEVMNLAGENE